MFKKNILKSVTLVSLSFLASVSAQSSRIVDSMEDDTSVFHCFFKVEDPMGEKYTQILEELTEVWNSMEVDSTGDVSHFMGTGTPVEDEGTQSAPITTLPNEILDHIFSFLPRKDMANVEQVRTNWYDTASCKHGSLPTLSTYLFEANKAPKARTLPDKFVAKCLAHRMAMNGFAPLENIFISPNQYPQGTRLLNASDLAAHLEMVLAWYSSLFGEPPLHNHPLALVMAALPQILIEDQTNAQTLARMAPYVDKAARQTCFVTFTGDEGLVFPSDFEDEPAAFVVRAQDFQEDQDTFTDLLDTRDDHRLILVLDGEAFIKDGVLTLSSDNIPSNLHHLSVCDPFGKVTSIGDYFLAGNKSLRSFHGWGLSKVTSIGNACFIGVESLTFFDGRGLSSVTTIGHGFLQHCDGLTVLDLRGFEKLTTIEGDFLKCCLGFRSFNTRGLENVTLIGPGFMFGCKNLISFDSIGLKSLSQVWSYFLTGTGLSPEEQAKINAYLTSVLQANAA
ncbi:MAG: F-box-like domain-containing protein [Proteobacteria bacterium]|nr:F-box-like domain-containing protein [Pseudomonadota bacterium]